MDYIRYVDIDEILERVKGSLLGKSAEEIARLCKYYQTFHEMWGTQEKIGVLLIKELCHISQPQ